MKRIGEIAKQVKTPKGRLRPEIAVPVTAGLVAVTIGVVAAKTMLDRKRAREQRFPQPAYSKLSFSPLDEVDRDLGSHGGWAVAQKLPQGQKRPRHQILVVTADAKRIGMDSTDPHGTSDRPALAIRKDNSTWWVARLPEDIAEPEDYDPRLVVGVELSRQDGLAACLGRLTQHGFFVGVPSETPASDQVMDAKHFAECYDTLIVRS